MVKGGYEWLWVVVGGYECLWVVVSIMSGRVVMGGYEW